MFFDEISFLLHSCKLLRSVMCSFEKFPTFFCVSLDTAESIMVSSTTNVSSLLVRLETGSESCKLPTKCTQLYRLKCRGQLGTVDTRVFCKGMCSFDFSLI